MKILKDKAYQNRGVADSSQGQNSTPSGLGYTKTKKHEAHTCPTKFGMGDYYGSGFKAPVGKIRDDTVGYRPVSRKQLGTPPRSVV